MNPSIVIAAIAMALSACQSAAPRSNRFTLAELGGIASRDLQACDVVYVAVRGEAEHDAAVASMDQFAFTMVHSGRMTPHAVLGGFEEVLFMKNPVRMRGVTTRVVAMDLWRHGVDCGSTIGNSCELIVPESRVEDVIDLLPPDLVDWRVEPLDGW